MKNIGKLMIVTTILCKMVLISGCYDARKALDKAQRKDPKEVAKFTREKFPCIETKSDTTIRYTDSLIYVPCPDSGRFDTVEVAFAVPGKERIKIVQKTVQVPVKVPVKVVQIEHSKEDSAKIAELSLTISQITAEKEKYRGKYDNWKGNFLWLLIACAVLLVTVIIQFKVKSSKKQ